MKNFMKKFLVCCSVFSLLLVSGCQKGEEEPQKEELTLITNDVYEAPSNPTQEQIKVFNELSEALKSGASDDKIASLVAVNFAYDFFSLYNKTDKNDIGGLQFLPSTSREEFVNMAAYKYYNNYDTVVSQYSKDDLPNVIMHEVTSTKAGQFSLNGITYDGYAVALTLKYKDSKISADALKTSMNMQVIDMNGVYYVIAAED